MIDPKSDEFKQIALDCLKAIARQNQYVVSDMVVTQLEHAGYKLDNYSALGGVFLRAGKEGILSKTDKTQQSTRERSNSAKTVWVSLIYNAPTKSREENVAQNILTAALAYNAAMIAQASLVISMGELTISRQKTVLAKFEQMVNEQKNKQDAIIKEFQSKAVGGSGK